MCPHEGLRVSQHKVMCAKLAAVPMALSCVEMVMASCYLTVALTRLALTPNPLLANQ